MIVWQDFHFIRPEFLLAIVPLLLLAFWLRRLNAKQSGWQGFVASHLYQHLVSSKDGKAKRPPFMLLALCWLLACIAAAGPTWQKLPQPVYQVNTGKVLVLDMSLSMRATDVVPDRLARAKFKALDLLDAIDDGEFGLVVYAGDAFVVSPLTADKTNLSALIPSLRPEIMPIAGSYPLIALEQAEQLLTSAGYNKGEIYWFTDGIELDDVDDLREHMLASAFEYSILAIGSEEGAPIKQLDGSLLKDLNGNIVIPRLNKRYLDQIVSGTSSTLTSMSNDDSDIQSMQLTTLVLDQQPLEQDVLSKGDQWQDMGAFVVLVILPFAAYAFRRGILILPLVLVTGLASFTPSTTYAQTNLPTAFKNADQQGLEAFSQEQYGRAAKLFEDPMWRAAALYKNKDYESALAEYTKIQGTEASYNKGNTLAQLGDLQGALDAYNEVLQSQPDHQNALTNKQIVEQLLQQQEQQQQEQQSSDDAQENNQQQDSQQENNQQQSDSDNQDSQEQNSQQQSDSQNQDSQNGQEQQSDQQQSEQSQSESQEQQAEQEEQQNAEQGDDKQQDAQNAAQQAQATAFEDMTAEEREQMQRMQTLLNKVPDDPAYLLQRKMLLESQQRRRERLPSTNRKDW